MQGFLLAIEGIDGSGKRSIRDAIAERVASRGWSSSTFAFPDYGTSTGQAIADYLRSREPDLPAEAAAVLFATDRLQYREKLDLALSRGEFVIVDRYVASNAAYQAARVSGEERARFGAWVEALEYGLMRMPRPSMTLLLDVNLEESQRRTSSRDLVDGRPGRDHYESDGELLSAAIAQYRTFAFDNTDWELIEAASATLQQVIDACWSAVLARIDA